MIIDIHTHFGYSTEFFCPDSSWKTAMDKMDVAGCDLVINSHALGWMHNDQAGCVENGLRLWEQSGHRIYNYLHYDPRHAEECGRFIQQYADDPAFVGIKIHPSWHETPADDISYQQVWELADAYRLPILAHTWTASPTNPRQAFAVPQRFTAYVEKYPRVSLIMGHAGGRTGGIRIAAQIAAQYPNVYLDTAGDVYNLRLIHYLASIAGPEKILFGSDMNWFDPMAAMGMILGADISDENKALIMGGNAQRVFSFQ